jgi:hypothetical protein
MQPDDRELCIYCHKRPVVTGGKFCSRVCYTASRHELMPASWRQMHAWMVGYQQTAGLPPKLDEIVQATPFANRSGPAYALNALCKRGLVEIVGPEGHMRRYRAVSNLPARKP